jgi:transcriptional regulator with XRE-family HTH domain
VTADQELGGWLRAARERAGRSQSELARVLGVAQTSVSAIERGVYAPNAATFAAMADACGVDAEEAARLWSARLTPTKLRGPAAATVVAVPDPAGVSRRAWVGAVRARHGFTRRALAAQLGVPERAVAGLEREDAALPGACQHPDVLASLAVLGGTDELALRRAWQPEEVTGLEHLVGRDVRAVVATAGDLREVLRWLLLTGWTQASVAAAAGVSRPAVHHWLAGTTSPSTQRLDRMATALRVPAQELRRFSAPDAPASD